MQKPSIGRIVIAQAEPVANNGADICPAIVTRVWSERPDGGWTVNVRLIHDGVGGNGADWKTSLALFETEEQAREYGLGGCFWPPRV